MVLALNPGFPRVGVKRELKKACESYWKGDISANELQKIGKQLRERHWKLQKDAGIDFIPVNDFSYYDHVLDMSCLLGVVPERYNWSDTNVDFDTYFAMARGSQKNGRDVIAMEMTKWFDTNYHYIVPELEAGQKFEISSTKLFEEVIEAKQAGITPVPVLVGPVTYLSVAKSHDPDFDPVSLAESLIAVYAEIFDRLIGHECTTVQLDEPCLVTDLRPAQKEAYELVYNELARAVPDMNITLNTYFGALRDNLDLAFSLPVSTIQIDLVRAPEQLDDCIAQAKKTDKALILGLVDGRNIWKNDLSASLAKLEKAKAELGTSKTHVSASSSLLHTPFDLDEETQLDPAVKNWMAYAKQKLVEIRVLADAAEDGRDSVAGAFTASDKVAQDRKTSTRIHNKDVQKRLAGITANDAKRKNNFAKRRTVQQAELNLPAFPTTTIGSFPQTSEIRAARAAFKKGDLTEAQYEDAMKKEIEDVVRYQEEIGIDVLVHGEPERNDMVEYFGEQLEGFAFSKNGWVQSYGSRCVKPPIIFGDVSRPTPMTVQWSAYAQGLTEEVMKGMLTGPITILQWSFVRDDQPREATCKQIALAIRDEVVDLEKAGIRVIQIDEPAIREGLPLRKADRKAYLNWAVESFRLSASGVEDGTQIHTHMCYSEFNDIIDSIGAMDADVISIETSRSQMELLDAFVTYKYPNEIGPGVYDIHSPRIPSKDEMVDLLEKAVKVIPADQIWVNPDCGLKTRGWAEVKPALQAMVDAAREVRQRYAKNKAA
jgi:5-methyltetrahydropteroyltriglutamate--homocysteine methyltransferase